MDQKNYKAKLLTFAIIIIFLNGLLGLQGVFKDSPYTYTKTTLIAHDQEISVIIADTYIEKARGLSGIPSLDNADGMLFVFDEPAIHQFWMKGMQFDLDFVWLRDFEVVEITTDVSSAEEVQENIIQPSVPVDMVLELPAGGVSEFGIEEGMILAAE